MRHLGFTVAPLLIAGISLFLFCAAPAPAGAEVIGSVKIASGAAAVVREGVALPATPGFKLQAGDFCPSCAAAMTASGLPVRRLLRLARVIRRLAGTLVSAR